MAQPRKNPGCLGILLSLFNTNSAPPPSPTFPYGKRDKFLSDGELRFYHVLKPLIPDGYTLITKVRLSDLFFVRQPHKNQGARNKIDRKHVDFVICESNSMQPALAIELDDSSHQRKDRAERDAFVDQVFKAAELPLLHVKVVQNYDSAEIQSQIQTLLTEETHP